MRTQPLQLFSADFLIVLYCVTPIVHCLVMSINHSVATPQTLLWISNTRSAQAFFYFFSLSFYLPHLFFFSFSLAFSHTVYTNGSLPSLHSSQFLTHFPSTPDPLPLYFSSEKSRPLQFPLLEYFIIVVKYRLTALYYMANGIVLCESG